MDTFQSSTEAKWTDRLHILFRRSTVSALSSLINLEEIPWMFIHEVAHICSGAELWLLCSACHLAIFWSLEDTADEYIKRSRSKTKTLFSPWNINKLWITVCKLNHDILFEVIIYHTRRNIEKLSYLSSNYISRQMVLLTFSYFSFSVLSVFISVWDFFPKITFEFLFRKTTWRCIFCGHFIQDTHFCMHFCKTFLWDQVHLDINSNSDHLCASQTLERGRSLTV